MCASKTHFQIQKTQIDLAPDQTWNLLRNIHTITWLCPPWLRMECINASSSIEEGSEFQIRIHHGILKGKWKIRVTSLRKGFLIGFEILSPCDQIWIIWTKVLPGESTATCIIEDRVEFKGSTIFGNPSVRIEKVIREILYYRHRTLKNDLQSLGAPTPSARQTLLIAGGSGLVGRHLTKLLRMRGHEVRILSTQVDERFLHWDPEKGMIQADYFVGVDTVINLAGSAIACRWNSKNRQRILDSRVKSTHQLVKTLLRVDPPPRQFIQTSATGFYGYDNQSDVGEDHPKGHGFLADTCETWENQTKSLDASNVKKKVIRLGVVLSPEGGVLQKLIPLFKKGLGGKIGTGKQLFPWVSINDLCRVITFLVENTESAGVFNVCAPQPLNNQEFTRCLARSLNRRAVFPVPGFLLRLIYGQMAKEALLGGIGVNPDNLIAAGFHFQDQNLEETLKSLLGRS